MSDIQVSRSARVNPIEILALVVILGVLVHSLVSLFRGGPQLQALALSPGRATASVDSPSGRGPASLSPAATAVVGMIEVGCGSAEAQSETGAAKVRLTGSLCGAPAGVEDPRPQQATIANEANHYQATVFADPSSGKFSTDYIPMQPGRNVVRVDFKYAGGRSFSQTLAIERK